MSRAPRSAWFLFATVGSIATLVFGIGCIRDEPGGGAVPSGTIVLGVETVPHASPVWIAEAKGYFRKQGLDVTIRPFDSGRTALFTMLDEGGIDIATAAQTPVIARSFDRDDYAILAGMCSSDRDIQMLVRRDRGIATGADLKGRTIGATGGSSGHFFLGLFLAFHHLQLSDIRMEDIEATALPGALIEGRVDGIVTWQPHIFRAAEALGERAAILPCEGMYREDFYFIARRGFLGEHPDRIERFLRAVQEAEQFIRENEDESKRIVQRRLRLDDDVLDASWKTLTFALFLDQSILVSLEEEARWAIDSGMTDAGSVPNYLRYIDSDGIKKVRPEALTIAGR